MVVSRNFALSACLIALTSASPAPTPPARPNPVLAAPIPNVTPYQASPVLLVPTRTFEKRADILSKLSGGVNSVLSALGSVPSYVASGVPNFFQGFPTKDKVQSELGLSNDQLAALPTQVLNIPPYANWSGGKWNVRFHGNVYLQPNTSVEKLNQLANVFVPGDLNTLPADQQAQARNFTAGIFVVQRGGVPVYQYIEPAPSAGASGEQGGGGGVTPAGGNQNVTLPYLTTDQGDFDAFVPIDGAGLQNGNETQQIQKLNVYANGASLGNATAYLVPEQGYTIVSDIDDILRVTKIYQPKEGLLNSFARPFVPWLNMPDIYANWSKSIPNVHFHYLTTTPEQVTRNYMEYIYKTYPGGSFDTRPLNFSDVSAVLAIRKFLLTKIFDTYPKRKFVLVADTSNSDVMADYPEMAHTYPDNVACILLRNTSATDDDKFPYNTKGFKGLNQTKYMFFRTTDDLVNIDITSGNCWNSSVPQNVTFGYQDELLGIHGSAAPFLTASWITTMLSAMAVMLFIAI